MMGIVRAKPRHGIADPLGHIAIEIGPPPTERAVADDVTSSQRLQIEVLKQRGMMVSIEYVLPLEVTLAPRHIITNHHKARTYRILLHR